MKLLVFAHTPPPHHGQSLMVQKMLEGFGGDRRQTSEAVQNPHGIECYHVNARVSQQLEDIGEFRIAKLLLMLGYCFKAIWCRFRYNIPNFYYVPAPGKRSALYRDWLVMAICRPFFKRLILHWHASGQAKWLERVCQANSRSLTYKLGGKADLSIVLSSYGRQDAEKLYPRSVAVICNGIEDPCPAFRQEILPTRQARLAARRKLLARMPLTEAEQAACGADPAVYHVLFLSHCSRDKGLFEAVEGVLLANERLVAQNLNLRLFLTIAGTFMRAEDEAEFQRVMDNRQASMQMRYVGFAKGREKSKLFESADVFCFPSYLESFGLVLAEAMAYGLPAVASRCGALPEVLPQGYPCLVTPGSAQEVADALLRSMDMDVFEVLRQRYAECFTMDRHLTSLSAAIRLAEGRPDEAFANWEHRPADSTA